MNQVEVKRHRIEIYSYIIGLVSICIIGRMLGDNGITFLVIALEIFFLFATITAGALADSLGRILRGRNAKGQYRNAQFIRKRAMLLHGVTGMLLGIIFAVCAGVIARSLFGMQYSISIMIMLAPALFLTTISSVLAGYFRGEGAEFPTVVAGVLRQIIFMGLSILFVNLLKNYGEKVSSLLGEEAFTAMYGGVGVAIAFDLTELLVLLFLALLFWGNRKAVKKSEAEGLKRTESFADTIRILYGTKGMSVMMLILAELPLCLGAMFYRKSVADAMTFAGNYGVFAGRYLVVCGLAVLPILASLVVVNARTAGLMRKEELQRNAKISFQGGIQGGVACSLFFAVYIALMAEQISGFLGREPSRLAASMLQQGSALVILVVLGVYFSKLLLLVRKQYYVLGCLGGMNILFILALSVLLNLGKAGVMALVYASLIAGTAYCLLVGFFCCQMLHAGIEWIRVFVMPLVAACVMGLLCLLLGKLCTPHLGNTVTVIVSMVSALVIYWAGLLLMRCFREQELKYIPGGKLIHTIGQMLRVF